MASKYPTQPKATGKWHYTTNTQRVTGAGKVRIAAMSPSLPRNNRAEKLHSRAVSLSKKG